METQENDDMKMEGYCKVEEEIKTFVPTESPRGFFVCCNCGFRTNKLELLEKFDYTKIKFEDRRL